MWLDIDDIHRHGRDGSRVDDNAQGWLGATSQPFFVRPVEVREGEELLLSIHVEAVAVDKEEVFEFGLVVLLENLCHSVRSRYVAVYFQGA